VLASFRKWFQLYPEDFEEDEVREELWNGIRTVFSARQEAMIVATLHSSFEKEMEVPPSSIFLSALPPPSSTSFSLSYLPFRNFFQPTSFAPFRPRSNPRLFVIGLYISRSSKEA